MASNAVSVGIFVIIAGCSRPPIDCLSSPQQNIGESLRRIPHEKSRPAASDVNSVSEGLPVACAFQSSPQQINLESLLRTPQADLAPAETESKASAVGGSYKGPAGSPSAQISEESLLFWPQ